MSKDDLLYVRNMSASESEENEDLQDVWDDSKLNRAYDKALSMANIEVAKRLAMSTNTQVANDGSKTNKPTPNSASKSQKKQNTTWKAGMHCRAVYEEDGLEYEAFVIRVIDTKECVVRFLGYENSEIVKLNSLKPSLGKRERNKQIEEALVDNMDDGLSIRSHTIQDMDVSDRPQSCVSLVSVKRKKSKKNKSKKTSELYLPELPSMPLPDIAHLKNMVAMDLPLPPPPPIGFPTSSHKPDSEDQAISSMLLSWYMSGYYTGLYQGMKRERNEKKHHCEK
ncbi:survival motor neuron protein isoform X2 [Bicyclus anynana]|uniref:Survival motor neuron protein isoform X2 n=1 Tax=Bicyclus anynana TaxID=110368 RepID=A0A6J1NDJ0_BICAN|nr:survival motor neuron protein isoform X2 [Bicyclus anynana]